LLYSDGRGKEDPEVTQANFVEVQDCGWLVEHKVDQPVALERQQPTHNFFFINYYFVNEKTKRGKDSPIIFTILKILPKLLSVALNTISPSILRLHPT
jgi:hypothetical protein